MKERIKSEEGFTLVELLAVIVILGLLMAIAIPSVTRYITQSRKKTLVNTVDSYITAVVQEVNDGDYHFSDSTKVYAIPIECISLEKGGTNPFGEWMQANENYWAYVLVQYDNVNYNYKYGFTFKDSAGYGMYPTVSANIDEKSNQVKTGYDDLTKPTSDKAIKFVSADKWNGFEITSDTELIVLGAESEGQKGNSETTCTLCQKGDNYEQVEEEKRIKAVPKVSLEVSAKNNKLVFTGIFENYNESTKYYDVTGHGILYIQQSRIGSRTLTVNTSGRTRVNFTDYTTDGSFSYHLKPSNLSTVYAIRAFLIYIDSDTGKTKTVYSNMMRTSYNGIAS